MSTENKNARLQIWIAVIATLLPIITSIVFNLTQEKIKQINVYYSESEKLIKKDSGKFEKIRVYYDSSLVTNISILHLMIINTGDYSITMEDFVDSPITFQVSNKDEIKRTKLPDILDVILINDADQQNSALNFDNHNSFNYKPSLLNPGERVEIDILMPDNPNYHLKCIGKIRDGRPINMISIDEIKKPNRFKLFVNAIQTLFVYKWISVLLSLITSIIVTLGGIGFIVNSQRGESSKPNLNFFGWIIGVSVIALGVLFTGFTVVVIVL